MLLTRRVCGVAPSRTTSRRRVTCRAAAYQLRVCLNRTCKSQGSAEVLKFVQDLCLDEVEATGVSCLGQCGSGPNLMILPLELGLSHVATVAQMTEVLKYQCQIEIEPELVLATQLRLAGNAAAREGEYEEAEEKYTEALGLQISSQRHLLHANRSGIRLRARDLEGALADALAAIETSPKSFTTGYMRLIDVYYLQKDYQNAAEALMELAQRCPEFRSSSEYKVISEQLTRDLENQSQLLR